MVLQYILQNLYDSLSLTQNTVLNLPACKENHIEIEFENETEVETLYNGSEPILPFANSEVFQSDILSWKRLTASSEACKDVYEVTFDIQGSNFTFKAGDTIGIIPQNTFSEVSVVIKQLELRAYADCSYKLITQKGSKLPPHIPSKSSLRHVLTHCVDLRGVLKKLFLLALSRHTKDETERKILEFLCSKEGSTAYQTHILDQNLSIVDLFTTFTSCRPPVQVLLENLPRLQPRPYSIVNSGQIDSNLLKICFSVVATKNNKKGLVTGWLEDMILNKECDLEKRLSNLTITNDCDNDKVFKVPFYLRKNMSGFSLPDNFETPLILIGPGTGVAPFIGFLQERELFMNKNPEINLGEVWLFFGCRNPDLDFIYEKELNEFLKKGVLKKLCTAFSRVESSEFKYIQDALKQNCEEITLLIKSRASIFVCGDLNSMAAQVKHTMTQCLATSGHSQDEAKDIIANMQKEKRYVVDAWS